MLTRAITLLSLSFLFTFTLTAQAYTGPGIPTGFVNDYTGTLSAIQKETLENKLSQFEKDSSNEIAIAIIANLDGDTIENYAVELFKEWQIGKKEQDNGILILVVKDDRKMRIEVGYGLEGAVTDAQAGGIIRDILTPAFRNNDFYSGLEGAVDTLIAYTKGEVPPAQALATTNNDLLPNILGLVFIFLVSIGSLLGATRSYWLGGAIGVIIGVGIGIYLHSFNTGLLLSGGIGILGLFIDYIASRASGSSSGLGGPFIGGGSSYGGSDFSGFGGGSSGGGGASGNW